jgi:hypothetical protein
MIHREEAQRAVYHEVDGGALSLIQARQRGAATLKVEPRLVVCSVCRYFCGSTSLILDASRNKIGEVNYREMEVAKYK